MLKIPHKAKPTPMTYKMGEHDLVHIGPHTYANNGLNVDWWGGEMRLRIGSYCSIADSAAFFLSHGHRIDWITSYPFARGDDYWLAGRRFPDGVVSKGDIEIGSDAWIGNGTRILSGIRVGHGAVVGTGAVVTADVPPYAFVAGNPARIIRYRFPPEVVAELLRIAWWNWPEDRIRQHLDVLLSSDVERLRRLVDGDAYQPLPTPTETVAIPTPTAPEPVQTSVPVPVQAPAPIPALAEAPVPKAAAPASPPPVVTVLGEMQEHMRVGKLADAVAIGEAALAKGVEGVALMMQIIRLYLHLGRNQEAWDLGRRVLDRDPDHADAHFQLGLAGMRVNRYEDALSHFRHVLDRTPDNVEALTNLAAVYFGLGFIQDALAQLEKAVKRSPGLVPVWQNYVSILNYDESAPLSRVMERHREAGRRIAKAAPKPPTSYANDRSPNRRLRIGYLSGDFFNHPAAHYVEPVLRCHDRENFDVHAYSLITWSDPVTEAFRGHVPNWHDVGLLDDDTLFRRIQSDRIDILVDLSGHTARNRVLVMARKPAPVMVNWIGYLNSMGMKAFDYALLDPHLLSPAAGKEFVEKPCLLPNTAYCYTPLIGERTVAPSPWKARGHITFGCFNNPAKLSRVSIAAWAAILKEVPDSRLLFKYKTYGSPMVQRRVLDAMAGHDIPADRIVFEGFSPLGSFLDAFGSIDIALDSFPYTGVTTTMHTLFMGVPVVTLEGDTPMQRFGRTALTGIGRPDWIARTPEEYVAITLRIVAEVQRDPNLRQDIQKRMLASPLMQHERFVRDLETAYHSMWRRWCEHHGRR
jgi:protein O-GlcNAc transferase